MKKRGFTIIEMLVSVFILMMAISAGFISVNTALTSVFYARDQVTAYFLAQEAIEVVKNERDSFVPWKDKCDGNNEKCGVDPYASVGNQLFSCGANESCLVVKRDSDKFIQSQTDGYEETKFSRSVTFLREDNKTNVEVIVSWKNGEREVKVHQYLFDWRFNRNE